MSRLNPGLEFRQALFFSPRCRPTTVVLIVLLVVASLTATADDRIVAIGDVHGNYDALVELLQQGNLINKKLNWSGKRATLIFTGDLLDRGPDSRKVLDLLMKLEKQANRNRGHLIVLLGNHEIMNMTGDLRYVSSEEYASFADKDSAGRRSKAYRRYIKFLQERAQTKELEIPAPTQEAESNWMQTHPKGYLEHRAAYGPEGKYGRWLRRRPVISTKEGIIFLHGGVSPELAEMSLQGINERVWSELEAFDSIRRHLVDRGIILPLFTLGEMTRAARTELDGRTADLDRRKLAATQDGRQYVPSQEDEEHIAKLKVFLGYPGWLSFHPRGPVWFRGYSEWKTDEGEENIQLVLTRLGARHIVVGHTVQPDGRIHHRFDKQVVFIDTGMLSSYYPGGRPSLVEIRNGEWEAVYLDGRDELLPVLEKTLLEAKAPPKTPPETKKSGDTKLDTSTDLLSTPTRVWFDPNGNRLPFTRDEEIMEFLSTARVLSSRWIGQGITHPRKLLMEKDGIQMHAIFRDVDRKEDIGRLADGSFESNFRDSFIFEKAAYELSRLLGFDSVPPVVLRKYRGTDGSIQVWIEAAMTWEDRIKRKLRPPNLSYWNHQLRSLKVFDELIQNTDRNSGNLLIDKEWKLWFIDHTRAFRRSSKLRDPKRLNRCERSLWENLQALDESTLRRTLGPYLERVQIKTIMKRRDVIVAHFRDRIERRGEEKVLYDIQARRLPDGSAASRYDTETQN